MKNTIIFLFAMFISLAAQDKSVQSGVYHWKDLAFAETRQIKKSEIFEGSTALLKSLKTEVIILNPVENNSITFSPSIEQRLIIVKDGNPSFILDGKEKLLGPQSIITVSPNDNLVCRTSGNESATVYVFSYNTGKPADISRVDTAGSSFMINFNDLEFHPHDKGGLWDYYRKPTAMFGYTEMHVTSLNGNIKSHEPHTHNAAEFVLMISGNSEMQIGNEFYKAEAGDLYYLESNVPHAIQNISNEPCRYFAIQWE